MLLHHLTPSHIIHIPIKLSLGIVAAAREHVIHRETAIFVGKGLCFYLPTIKINIRIITQEVRGGEGRGLRTRNWDTQSAEDEAEDKEELGEMHGD